MKSSVGEVRSQFGPVGLIGKTARVIADRMGMTISTEGYINGHDVINRVFFLRGSIAWFVRTSSVGRIFVS